MSFSVLHYLALASKLRPLWLGFVRCGVIQLTWTLQHGTYRFKFSACCLHGWWSRHCVSYWNRATILVWWALSPGSLCVWTYSNIASELEDVLKLPSNEFQTLVLLDAALRRFLSLCSAYHGTCIPPGYYSPQLISLLRTISADSSSVGTCISDASWLRALRISLWTHVRNYHGWFAGG